MFSLLPFWCFIWAGFLPARSTFSTPDNIAPTVTGGIICNLLVSLLQGARDIHIIFDLQLRDLFLLFFFSTIVAAVLLVLQNVTGVGLALLAGAPPCYGLLGGSISFAGGHGTAIAWAQVAAEAGLQGAEEFGIACATFKRYQ